MPTLGQGCSKAANALWTEIAHCSALLPLFNLTHMDHCVHTTPSNCFLHHVWGSGHAIRPITVSTDPTEFSSVNTSVCWTSYLSGKDWKRQWYGLIYLCNLLWLPLCLIPSTPHNFQYRPRLTAFQEDTNLWHKNVFTWWFSKTLFTHFDCRTNVQKCTLCWQTRRNPRTLKRRDFNYRAIAGGGEEETGLWISAWKMACSTMTLPGQHTL